MIVGPALFVINNDDATLRVQRAMSRFFGSGCFTICGIVSSRRPPVLRACVESSSLLSELSAVRISRCVVKFAGEALHLQFISLFNKFGDMLSGIVRPSSCVSPSTVLNGNGCLTTGTIVSSGTLVKGSGLVGCGIAVKRSIIINSSYFFGPKTEVDNGMGVKGKYLFNTGSFMFRKLRVGSSYRVSTLYCVSEMVRTGDVYADGKKDLEMCEGQCW